MKSSSLLFIDHAIALPLSLLLQIILSYQSIDNFIPASVRIAVVVRPLPIELELSTPQCLIHTESGEKRRILKPQTHSLVCLMDFTHSFIKTSLVDSFASSVLHVNFLRFSATLTLSHGHYTAQCATCIPLSVLLYIKYIRVLIFGLACVGTRSCFSFLLTLAERRVNGKA